MDLALTDTERALRDSVRQFVRQEAPTGTLTGWTPRPQPWRPRLAARRSPRPAGSACSCPAEPGRRGRDDHGRGRADGGTGPRARARPRARRPASSAALLLRAAAPAPARDELLAGIAAGTRGRHPGAARARGLLARRGRRRRRSLDRRRPADRHEAVRRLRRRRRRTSWSAWPRRCAGRVPVRRRAGRRGRASALRPLTGFLHASYEVDFASGRGHEPVLHASRNRASWTRRWRRVWSPWPPTRRAAAPPCWTCRSRGPTAGSSSACRSAGSSGSRTTSSGSSTPPTPRGGPPTRRPGRVDTGQPAAAGPGAPGRGRGQRVLPRGGQRRP